jgi:hypothetical protein
MSASRRTAALTMALSMLSSAAALQLNMPLRQPLPHLQRPAATIMCAEPDTNPLTGEPLTGGLWAKMCFRGPGSALLYYLEDVKSLFAEVDEDGDGYIGAAELTTLMAKAGKESTNEEVAAMLSTVDVRKRDSEGNALIFAEQWAKAMVDLVREQTGQAKPSWLPWA